jgi:hypothetical protein
VAALHTAVVKTFLRLNRSAVSTMLATLPLWVLAACAELHVRSVSGNPQAPAYELRGPTLEHVEAEAARRCPQGYEVLRQSQQQTRLSGENFAVRWWTKATLWLDDDETQVQMAMACKVAAVAPVPVPVTPAPVITQPVTPPPESR